MWYERLIDELDATATEIGHATVNITDKGHDNTVSVLAWNSNRHCLSNTASWIAKKKRVNCSLNV